MAITWRNVAAPDFRTSLQGVTAAGDSFKGFADSLKNIGSEQREMNIFQQQQARETDIQAGKERILGATGTLDDWKNLGVEGAIGDVQDTKTRAALFDFYDKRDDVIRTETQADLAIEGAEQRIRLADAKDKRDQAYLGIAKGDAALRVKKDNRAQAVHDWDMSAKARQLSNEENYNYITEKLYEASEQGLTDSEINELAESLVHSKDSKGRPLLTGDFRQQALTHAKEMATTLTNLSATEIEQKKIDDLAIEERYMDNGINPNDPGMNQLNQNIAANNDRIAKKSQLDKTIDDSIKNYKDVGTYVNKTFTGNEEETLTSIESQVAKAEPTVRVALKDSLISLGYTDDQALAMVKNYRIPQGVILNVVQGLGKDRDYFSWGKDDEQDYHLDTSSLPSKLQVFAKEVFLADVLAKRSMSDNTVKQTQLADIQRQVAVEKLEGTRKLMRDKTSTKKNVAKILEKL